MTAAALVETLRARGVTLEPHGDRLRVRPAAAVTPDEVEALRQLKPEVLALLTALATPPETSARSPWPESLTGVGARRVIPNAPCGFCPQWTIVQYGDLPLCLTCVGTPETRQLAGYRAALHRVWSLMAQGADADPAACAVALDELARLLDDVGEPKATSLRRRWSAEWYWETGQCHTCGEPGPLHGDTP